MNISLTLQVCFLIHLLAEKMKSFSVLIENLILRRRAISIVYSIINSDVETWSYQCIYNEKRLKSWVFCPAETLEMDKIFYNYRFLILKEVKQVDAFRYLDVYYVNWNAMSNLLL